METLDTSKMEIVQTSDGIYRFVDHERQLLTIGFTKREGLIKNSDIIGAWPSAIEKMKIRYSKEYIGP